MENSNKIPFYAQFDGDEIDGVRYALGDAVKDTVDGGTRAYLEQQGRIARTPPNVSGLIPHPADKHPDDMNLAELRVAALAETAKRIDEESEESLRAVLNRQREFEAERGGDDMGGDKPMTVEALKAHVETLGDRAALDSLRADEVAGKNRPTALAAIDARITALG